MFEKNRLGINVAPVDNVVNPVVINPPFDDIFYHSFMVILGMDGDGLLLGLAHVAHLNRHSIPGLASFVTSGKRIPTLVNPYVVVLIGVVCRISSYNIFHLAPFLIFDASVQSHATIAICPPFDQN